MAIKTTIARPTGSFLGAKVNKFPKGQQEVIVDIIDTLNDAINGSISTTDLTLSGNLVTGGTITQSLTTDSTSKDTGAVILEGGLGVEKAIFSGTTINAGTRLTTGAGTVTSPSLVVGVNDNGLYEVSTTQQGVSIGNALVGGFNSTGLFTGAISEQTSLAGITYVGQNIESAVGSLTALAGGAQAGTALTRTFNVFSVVATTGDSAQLPVAVLGKVVFVRNTSAITMAVFGQTGVTIDGAAANASFLVYPGQAVTFRGQSATAWLSVEGTSFGTISAVTQATSITTGVTVNARKGTITTFTPSTAALTATTFTVTCNRATATANVRSWITEYGGTVLTNGLPSVFVKNKTASGFDLVIYNAHATNALATSLVLGFEIIN